MIPLIVPDTVLVRVPIVVGELKLPAELLNCKENILPALNTPDAVYEMLTLAPEQI